MTDKEKARAYDEALRLARDYYEDKNFEYLKGVLENIFCALKEPDDEEIRKTLLETFSNFNAAGTFWSDTLRISKDNVIAWLKKQGKENPLEGTLGYIFDDLRAGLDPSPKQDKQKPIKWSKEDERNLQGIIDEIEANKNNAPDYDLATYDRFLSWLKSLKERIKGE